MYDSSSYVNPTPLAHADTSRDVLPRGGARNLGASISKKAELVKCAKEVITNAYRERIPKQKTGSKRHVSSCLSLMKIRSKRRSAKVVQSNR
ncbi:hypothetical protein TNCV_1233041 [Trichonephila clavipes]|nr:hypothetical protein TNCV_1233041 [Trichonephila clavipes]